MSNASNPLAINYKNLGVAKHKEGKYKDACEDYLRSIEIEPNDSETHYFMGLSLIAVYDFDRAFWNSASSQVGEDGREYFMLDGEIGLQEVYAYDEYGDDVTEGLWIWGINGGKGTLMTFPILVDISRFENAMYDLMDECPGIKSKY